MHTSPANQRRRHQRSPPPPDSPPACGRAGRPRDPHHRRRVGRVRHPRPDAGARARERRPAHLRTHSPVRRGAGRRPRRGRRRAAPGGPRRSPRRWPSTPWTTATPSPSRPSATGSAAATSARSSPTSSPAAAACSTTSWTATAASSRPPRPASTSAPSPARRSSRPVDGKVTAIKKYSILGRYNDVEIDIRLAARPVAAAHRHAHRQAQGADRRRGAARHDRAGRRARVPGGARPGAQPVHLGQRRPRAAGVLRVTPELATCE